MKKTILMILALWLVISLIPAAAATEVPVRTQYQCGEYIYWAFDEATGTLTIGGQGLMDDYGPGETPWESFKDKIQTVVFGGGVSYVGSYRITWVFFSFRIIVFSTFQNISQTPSRGGWCTAIQLSPATERRVCSFLAIASPNILSQVFPFVKKNFHEIQTFFSIFMVSAASF